MTSILNQPLDYRCLALTGAFETAAGFPGGFSHVAGNFDGQGISFGALQWNLGQGTLQPLLAQMEKAQPALFQQVLDDQYAGLKAALELPGPGQLAWASSIQDAGHRIAAPWLETFQTLGSNPAFQEVQRLAAGGIYRSALTLQAAYGLKSERGLALMFDIHVQNGGISADVKAQIESGFAQLASSQDPMELEVSRLRIVANRRSEAANPRWIEDIRARKLAIANGQGTVHGQSYNLAADFGIRLEQVATVVQA